MLRPIRTLAGVAAAGLLASSVATGGTASGSAARADGPARASAATVSFTPDWKHPVVDRANIAESSPVVVANGGNPFVVVGDLKGNLRARYLSSGDAVPGWSNVNTGFAVRAPLSSDGTNVYVPVAQDGKDNYPQFKKYSASGGLLWSSNPATQPNAGGFLLAGLSLAKVAGTWKAFGASSGHWMYGVDTATGRQAWRFRNADSTMATPALANFLGSAGPQVAFSNDKSRGADSNGRNGGHLRLFTFDGKQFCSADQLVDGDVHRVAGYNNSSPAIAEVGGRALIFFGSTGPVQTGAGGNQLVAYDTGCLRRWASAPFAGQALASPTVADVLGQGTPQVIQIVPVIESATFAYPRVYVLDAATGRTLVDSGTKLRTYGGNLGYPSSISAVTADVDGDGDQDLFVPGNKLLVLDGQSMDVLSALDIGGAIQNSPLLTDLPNGGVRVTVAGYSGNNGNGVPGGIVRSWTTSTGSLGALGWPEFGHDPQLSGLQGTLHPPYNQLVEGQVLNPGVAITSSEGGYKASMQSDGNLVVSNPNGSPRWSTRTSVRGSKLYVRTNGTLEVISPGGTVLWRGGKVVANGVERLVMSADGYIRIYSATPVGIEMTAKPTPTWSNKGL